MVFQYADKGSLHKYLSKDFINLTWQTKLQIFKDTAFELRRIHIANYIYTDFYSGNILQGQQSYIADLGLFKKKDDNASESKIYSVMLYVPSEVLAGKQQFIQAADIYGFGVIMAEMSTSQRPFDGR